MDITTSLLLEFTSYLELDFLSAKILTAITFFKINLFIYFWLCWVFVAARRLSLIAASGVTLGFVAWASHGGGFSCCRAWALGMRASVVVACGLSSCGSGALEHRLSSCGTQA